MQKLPMKSMVLLIVIPISIGAGILGDYTLGNDFGARRGDPGLGFGVGLTVFALLSWFLLFSEPPYKASPQLACVLVACGTLCILFSLGLQFYIASLFGDNSRRIAELLAQRGGNVNLNVDYPASVKAISYLTALAGIAFAAVGVRMATGRGEVRRGEDMAGDPLPSVPRAAPVAPDTGYRA